MRRLQLWVLMMAGLTQQRLRTLLSYEPETGDFRWLVNKSSRARAGSAAASRHNAGYLAVRIDGTAYLLHRLAWLYVHGRWPQDQVDHINGDRADNRLVNLRECSNAENCQNVRPHRDGAGTLGVSLDKRRGRWQAGIGINGERRFLGYFATKEEAGAAYRAAKARLHQFHKQSGAA